MQLGHEFIWVILTVYLESRNQPDIGEKAVTKVILNRAVKKAWPLANIIFARKQFSCWNEGVETPQTTIHEIFVFARCAANCWQAYLEWEKGDNLRGATHYFALKGMVTGKPPVWAKDMTFITEIKDHKFYRED